MVILLDKLNYLKCPTCNENLSNFRDNSYLDLPVDHCKNCDLYLCVGSKEQLTSQVNSVYTKRHWGSKNIWDAKIPIESNYTDKDSIGKKRNWISQISYCGNFLKNTHKILEIGSGQGQATYWFEQLGHVVLGLEPDAQNVTLINSKLKNSKCVVGFAEDFSIDEKFDSIWISHVLEHLIDPIGFLNKIQHNLNENGFVFIEVPNCTNPLILNMSINKVPHTFHFTPKSLMSLINKTNFKIIHMDCFRPAKKIEGLLQKFFHTYPHYPRIRCSEKDGKVIRVILTL